MIRQREEITEKLKQLADEEYKIFNSGLCPETQNILGVRIPKLRKLAKEFVDEDWKETYKNIGNEYYEEIMLQGIMLGYVKLELKERFNYLESFIPKIDNWAICDTTCAGLKFTKDNEKEVFEFLQKYLNSNKEFELRFAIVMLLNYFLTDEYINRVIEILDNITYSEFYYVKMAIAWTISSAYISYPEIIMKYLKENHLDDDTYNKTLQKIIESNKVGKREKNKIRRMKRKKHK